MGRRHAAAAARKARAATDHPEDGCGKAKSQEGNGDLPDTEPSRLDLQWDKLRHSFSALSTQLQDLQADAEPDLMEAERRSLQACQKDIESACSRALAYFVHRKQRSEG